MIEEVYNGTELKFSTEGEVFSPSGLDTGTKAMLDIAEIGESAKVLDLGCGYGFVGIYASKLTGSENVFMCDISDEAVRLSEANAKINNVTPHILKSDGFKSIDEREFDIILSNPPYHVDFSVPKHFIEEGFKRLKMGGCMYMVTKRLEWYKNKLTSVFGGVKVYERDGYYVFMALKKPKSDGKNSKNTCENNKNKLSKKLTRKYAKKYQR